MTLDQDDERVHSDAAEVEGDRMLRELDARHGELDAVMAEIGALGLMGGDEAGAVAPQVGSERVVKGNEPDEL